jgi:biofilm PGA synthesis N-glycosyltransferase PgaC
VVTRAERAGKSAAVNAGMTAVSGEVVVLSDASALLCQGSITALVRPLSDPSVGVVSGSISYGVSDGGAASSGARRYWAFEDRLRQWESASGSTVGVNGNLFAFRRADFTALPPGTVNDEFTIAMRIAATGLRVVYDGEARCTDVASTDLAAERRRRTRISAGRVQALTGPAAVLWTRPSLAFRVGSHKALRLVVPFALGVAVVLAPVHWLASGRRVPRTGWGRVAHLDRPLAGLIVGAEAAIGLATVTAVLAERRGRRLPVPLRLLGFAAHSAAAGAVGAVRGVRGRQSVLWRTGAETRDPTKGS